MEKFKAIIRVIKSISETNFGPIEVIREPLIEAESKGDVKAFLVKKYPQFFQNGKIYEKETKDQAQFFYVVIFPLYSHEVELINKGEWICDHCGHVHENKYISRPFESRKFEGKIFCSNDYKSGNDVVDHDGSFCYKEWKKSYFKNVDLPDDLSYINEKSLNYIYKITEKSSGKSYVGKTRNEPFFRWWNHLRHSSSPFGLYFRTTPISNWTFEVLDIMPPGSDDSDVFKLESEYIRKFNCIENGFNRTISNKEVRPETNQLQIQI